MATDLIVFAKTYPEARLIVEVKAPPALSSRQDEEKAAQQLARSMWGANCHYGLLMTPTQTYVLRDDFSAPGPESIRVTSILPTEKLLGRLERPIPERLSENELELLARAWLERLVTSYESALPDDPEVMSAFFPDLVGAVAEGRVETEAGVG
ncbi:MAG: hypothetical protein L0Z62_14330 [Gemmataceae bacterium]|nr:hypothetical protein [Gemmataceae bacterium]